MLNLDLSHWYLPSAYSQKMVLVLYLEFLVMLPWFITVLLDVIEI